MNDQLCALRDAFDRVYHSLVNLSDAIAVVERHSLTEAEIDEGLAFSRSPEVAEANPRGRFTEYLRAASKARVMAIGSSVWLPSLAAFHGETEPGEWMWDVVNLLNWGLSDFGIRELTERMVDAQAIRVADRLGRLRRLCLYTAPPADNPVSPT